MRVIAESAPVVKDQQVFPQAQMQKICAGQGRHVSLHRLFSEPKAGRQLGP